MSFDPFATTENERRKRRASVGQLTAERGGKTRKLSPSEECSTSDQDMVTIFLGPHPHDIHVVNKKRLHDCFGFFARKPSSEFRLICLGNHRDLSQWRLVEAFEQPPYNKGGNSYKTDDEASRRAIQLHRIMLRCMGPGQIRCSNPEFCSRRGENGCEHDTSLRLHRREPHNVAEIVAKLLVDYVCTNDVARYFVSLIMEANWGRESVNVTNYMSDSPRIWLSLSYTLRLEVIFRSAMGLVLDQYGPNDEQLRWLPDDLLEFTKRQFSYWKKDRKRIYHKRYEGMLPWRTAST